MTQAATVDTGVRGTPALRHDYFPGVDGLRALAVLSVMLFHLREHALPGGFLGVDIFFVISGFVVTQSIKNASFPSFGSFLAYFYARRIFRILPMLALTVLVTSVFFVLFVPEAWLSRDIDRTALSAIFGFSNMILARGNDYFSPTALYNPFTHTWSLGVEEQFYFVFPFIMYFGLRFRAPIVALAMAVSIAASIYWSIQAPLKGFYWLPSRFWELGAGMLLCLMEPAWRHRLEARPGLSALLAAGSLGILLVVFVVTPAGPIPTPWALLAVGPALALIAVLVARPRDGFGRIFGAAPMVGIGKISYSLYLWHWPVYVIMRWTVGFDQTLNAVCAVALTFVLAIASYRFVETPTRTWQRRGPLSKGLRPIGAGLATALATLGIVGTLFAFKPALSLSVTSDLAVWYPDTAWLDRSAGGCRVAEASELLSSVDVSVFEPKGCPTLPDRGALFVAGDSHVDAYQRMLKRFAAESGRVVRSYALPGCGVVNFRGEGASGNGRCDQLQDVVLDDLARRAGPGDVIFLPSLRVPRYVDQWGGGAMPAAPVSGERAAAIGARMEALTRRIRATGAEILFEAPTPVFRLAPFRCSDWFNRSNPACEPGPIVGRAEIEERRRFSLEGLRRLASVVPGVALWDPLPLLCDAEACDAFRDGKPLFFDQDHLSGYGNDVLLPDFNRAAAEAFTRAAGPSPAMQQSAR